MWYLSLVMNYLVVMKGRMEFGGCACRIREILGINVVITLRFYHTVRLPRIVIRMRKFNRCVI